MKNPLAVQVDSQLGHVASGYVSVEMRRELTDTTYLLFIDLSNANDAYRHTLTGAIRVGRFTAELIKDNASAKWAGVIGVITEIDGTSATVVWIEAGSLRAYGTSSFIDRKGGVVFPVVAAMDVEAGDLKYMASDFKDTGITALNTGTTIKNIADEDVAPAVGDIIIRAERVAGVGDAAIHYTAFYYTV